MTAADLASRAAAGFSIDVPPGWTESERKGLATDFSGPGDLLLEVDLTPQPTTNMLTAATKRIERAGELNFRDYKRVNLQAVPVRHTRGAVWKFNWTPAGRRPGDGRRHLLRAGDARPAYAGLRRLRQVALEHVRQQEPAALRTDAADLPDGPGKLAGQGRGRAGPETGPAPSRCVLA